MEFKLNVKIKEYPFKISYSDKIFSIGSCFSNEMSKKLEASKFKVLNNSFGVIFHPLAIENAFNRIQNFIPYESFEIFKNNELYFSWDHSSAFSNTSLDETLLKINNAISTANEELYDSSVIIITLATSWAYNLKKAGIIVSNCHKIPNTEFDKVLLSDKEIESSLKRIVDMLGEFPQEKQIIFTVSPVRHVRDGLVENTVGKGRLLNAVYKLNLAYKNVHYFPSYEILIDELRDYRFYKEDMIHPTQQAVDFIWHKFCTSFFTPETLEISAKVMQIKRLEEHKPKNTDTIAYKKFAYHTIKEMQELERVFGNNSFKNEIEKIKSTIKNAD